MYVSLAAPPAILSCPIPHTQVTISDEGVAAFLAGLDRAKFGSMAGGAVPLPLVFDSIEACVNFWSESWL